MKLSNDGIAMADCVKGRLYRFSARTFQFGVYDGAEGFIGIRTKFGGTFLDTEYHYDQGAPYGTVRNVEDTGIDAPSGIPIMERLEGSKDLVTGRMMAFDRPRTEGGRGWYFLDTGESGGTEARPCTIHNCALFDWLQAYWDAETLKRECPSCKAPSGAECTDPESGFHPSRRY